MCHNCEYASVVGEDFECAFYRRQPTTEELKHGCSGILYQNYLKGVDLDDNECCAEVMSREQFER